MSTQHQRLIFTPSSYTIKNQPQQQSHVDTFIASEKLKQFISHDHDYLAYFFQASACLLWTCSYIYNNQNDLNMYQANLARGLVGFFCNYAVLKFQGSKLNFQKPRIYKGLLIVNLCILAYLLILPFSQVYLPLPIVHTIGCTSIATVYIMDYFMNGVTITRNGGIGIVLAITGAVIMSNDRLILETLVNDYQFQSQFKNYRHQSNFLLALISFVLLLSRIIHSYGIISLKYYPQISVFQLNFHSSILAIISGGIGYMTQQGNKSFSVFWPSLITTGLGQFFCMTMFVYSVKLTKKTGNVMIINGLNILYAFMISYFRYGEKINIVLIVGSVSLFISMLIVIMQSVKAKKLQTQDTSPSKSFQK